MDILFKNNFVLTEELLLECSSVFTSKSNKFVSIFGLFICSFGLILESSLRDKFILATCLFGFIYMLFILPIIRAKKTYKQYLVINNYKPIQESVDFYNDAFEVISSNGAKVSVSYSNIRKIYNRNSMLVFLCKEDLLVFVKKDGFNQGTYDDFKTFIYTKSNLHF